MPSVEGRITGGDPRVKVARLASQQAEARNKWPLENPDLRVIESYPRLFTPLPSVRFNPFSGELHLATYVPDRTKPELTVKRWSQFGGLEELTGATVEIITQYSSPNGDLIKTTQDLMAFTQAKGDIFRSRSVPSAELDEFIEEATTLLDRNGFHQPILPLKDKIRKQIVAGLGPDSLDRRNPLIARTRLASAIVKLCMLEQIQDKIAKKYLELFSYLLPEFDLERSVAAGILAELHDPHSNLALLRTMGSDTDSPVKSAPWRGPLMQAYFGMFSNGRRSIDRRFFEGEEELLRRIESEAIAHYKHLLIEGITQSLEDGTNVYTDSV